VVSNIDPLQMGRILVEVPDILGNDPCIWAESASPLAGQGMGLYFVPPIKSGVWIEFQQGDPDHALWTGCWRGAPTDAPPLAKAAVPATPPIVLGTTTQNTIVVSDGPLGPLTSGGIMLQVGATMIVIGKDGIKIIAPKIELTAPMVNVNQGALVIT
jgi:Type VI secretion system/phage-baseplate injector OB domain